MIATLKAVGRKTATRSALLSTMGDRLAIAQSRFVGNVQGADWELEFLSMTEVDPAGKVLAALFFDADDRASAFREAERRFVAGEAAESASAQAPIVGFGEAFARRDWKELRSVLGDDFMSTDNRPGWMGSSDADEYVESMRIFTELSPDVASETVRVLAWGDHGRVSMTRVSGAQQDAGQFESVFVWLLVTEAGTIRQLEVWDVRDVDAALEHFEELRPGR